MKEIKAWPLYAFKRNPVKINSIFGFEKSQPHHPIEIP
jgi:hypothetical protein